MIKTFRWLYKLGYDKARNDILIIIEREHSFHLSQAQIKSIEELSNKSYQLNDKKMGSKEHEICRKELESVLNRIDPEKYPNFDRFLEMLL